MNAIYSLFPKNWELVALVTLFATQAYVSRLYTYVLLSSVLGIPFTKRVIPAILG